MLRKKALYYFKNIDNSVTCMLCPNKCNLEIGENGKCNVRTNLNGDLYTSNYCKISSISLEQISKQPIKKFMEYSVVLAVGSKGCNFSCKYCNNWVISQDDPILMSITPGELVQKAYNMKKNGNVGISYTYNEPTIWYEFVFESCILAKENGLKNILVTNGYINQEPLKNLLPFIDAINIDLKAFNNSFYKEICNGDLEPVKKTIITALKHCHVELTFLVIPGINDSHEDFHKMCQWIGNVSKDIPIHIIRFFPYHKLKDISSTSLESLQQLEKIALIYLKNVFISNVW